MNKTELIDAISTKSGLSKKDTETFFNNFINVVEDAVVDGEKVSLVGFMTIEAKKTDARKGRNPSTGESIDVPASKRISVKIGKPFKEAVKA
jgi:DNA-binding protein HU-beta